MTVTYTFNSDLQYHKHDDNKDYYSDRYRERKNGEDYRKYLQYQARIAYEEALCGCEPDEFTISKSTYYAVQYALNVLNNRFIDAEPIILGSMYEEEYRDGLRRLNISVPEDEL